MTRVPKTAHAAPKPARWRSSDRAAAADVCPVTGQARMSYRRAAEIFTALTRPLDPAGRGWTLHQLRAAQRPR